MKLNLGCGNDRKQGYVNLDLYNKKADIVHDLEKYPYPFKKDTFEEILAYNILEHLNDPYKTLLEIHRISKPKTIIKIIVPHFSGGNAWGDLQHKKAFNTFAFEHENLKPFFRVKKIQITFPKRRFFIKWFANKYKGFYDYNIANIFPADDIYVELEVIK